MSTPSDQHLESSSTQITPSTSHSNPSSLHQSTTSFPDITVSYTPFYCEENIYRLIQKLIQYRNIRVWACFVSNLDRRALLFRQKASKQTEEDGSYVIWDYHVFAVAAIRDEFGEQIIAIDRDSHFSLPHIISLEDYVEATFMPDLFRRNIILDPSLESRIRLVHGQDFLDNFASSREHMLAQDLSLDAGSTEEPESPGYIHSPPPYSPICGPAARQRGETHNLWTKFLDMRLPQERSEGEKLEDCYGVVVERPEQLCEWIHPL